MPWDFALILLALGVLVPWRGAVRVRELLALPQLSSADRLAVYASTMALQWTLATLVAWRGLARGLDLQALGLTLPDARFSLSVAAVLSLLLCALQLASLWQLARLPRGEQGFLGELARKLLPQETVESLVFVALAGTVALCEEFLYRGFVFAALEASSGSQLVAALGSALLFALAHAYQGRRGVAVTFVVGVVFAEVRIWTGSLAAPIVAHLVADLVAGLAGPRMLRAAEQPAGR